MAGPSQVGPLKHLAATISHESPPTGRPTLLGPNQLGPTLLFAFGKWRSLVAHLLWEQGVVGSNPAFPTVFCEHESYERDSCS